MHSAGKKHPRAQSGLGCTATQSKKLRSSSQRYRVGLPARNFDFVCPTVRQRSHGERKRARALSVGAESCASSRNCTTLLWRWLHDARVHLVPTRRRLQLKLLRRGGGRIESHILPPVPSGFSEKLEGTGGCQRPPPHAPLDLRLMARENN